MLTAFCAAKPDLLMSNKAGKGCVARCCFQHAQIHSAHMQTVPVSAEPNCEPEREPSHQVYGFTHGQLQLLWRHANEPCQRRRRWRVLLARCCTSGDLLFCSEM